MYSTYSSRLKHPQGIPIPVAFPVLLRQQGGLYLIIPGKLSHSRSQWPRGLTLGSAAAGVLGLWVRILPGSWMSVCLSFVYCQVEVSAACRLLVQRSLTECDVSECDRASSITRLWLLKECSKKSVSRVWPIHCWVSERLTNFISATSVSVCRLYLITLKLEQPLFYSVAAVLFLAPQK
jgi:hypothetical protein